MQTKINRRKFLQHTAMGSAGMMIAPAFTQAASVFSGEIKGEQVLMTGLTPISLIDNACMLAYSSGKLSLESQAVVTTDIHLRNTPGNKGRMAVAFPPRNNRIFDLIQTVKDNPETQFAEEKRALVFGWVAINAVDRYINASLKGENPEKIVLSRFHQDALVIQGFSSPEYYVQGASRQDVENMLHAILVRTVTRIHTLKPDSDDGIGWVNRMAAWRRKNTAQMKEFASAIVAPDNSLAGENFYRVHEDIIVAANKLQKAQDVEADVILQAVNAGGTSNYGKALAEATNSILSIDAFLKGDLSKRDLQDKLKL